MNLHQKISLKDIGVLNSLVEDYLSGEPKAKELSSYHPTIEAVKDVFMAKKGFKNRAVLVRALEQQYQNLTLSNKTSTHLNLLKEHNTFTVCTAHQLCLFTGPSYFIYKILSAIKLCKSLKAKYPEQNFVPVYWMGSEDHDFDEINHTNIYGKLVKWENDEGGAVGRMSLAGLDASLAELANLLGSQEEAQNLLQELRKYLQGAPTYGKAFQAWILELFAPFGLIVLDQDDANLKETFAPVMRTELLKKQAVQSLQKQEEYLEEHYHVQASSRPINLFYLEDTLRERIEEQDGQYVVLNTDITFTKETLEAMLKEHPERFSPNVILRPLYQETVLPNVAFVGGPGEVSYWLQLKDLFTEFNIVQPLILLRDMAVVMQKNHLEKLASWNIDVAQLFSSYDQIAKTIVEEESTNELSLAKEREDLEILFAQIKEKAIAIDKNMDRSVEGEKQKVLNAFANMESKLVRAEKKNFEQKLSQLENIQSKLLPNNILQERYDNFIPTYLKAPNYFAKILEEFNAFEQNLKVYSL